MKKLAVILFVLSGLFLIGSFTFISSGQYVNLIGGVVIASVLGFFGYRQFKKPAADESESKTHEYHVYIEKGGQRYHNDAKCSGMTNPKYIPLSEAKHKGFSACKKCAEIK